jgi:hypothetical protein
MPGTALMAVGMSKDECSCSQGERSLFSIRENGPGFALVLSRIFVVSANFVFV